MHFFAQCLSPAEVKQKYRELAKIHHPDMGGDVEVMKQLNAAYLVALRCLDGHKSMGSDHKEHTYRYDDKVENDVIEIVSKLISLHMVGVTIEIIGTWVWVYGEPDPNQTRQYTRQLGSNRKRHEKYNEPLGLGLRFHTKRRKWYWAPPHYPTHYSGIPMGDLRLMYGSRLVENEERPQNATQLSNAVS